MKNKENPKLLEAKDEKALSAASRTKKNWAHRLRMVVGMWRAGSVSVCRSMEKVYTEITTL